MFLLPELIGTFQFNDASYVYPGFWQGTDFVDSALTKMFDFGDLLRVDAVQAVMTAVKVVLDCA